MFFRMQPVLLVFYNESTPDKEAADMFDNLMSDVAMGNAEPCRRMPAASGLLYRKCVGRIIKDKSE
mgnify:CR=1 FL=1